MAKLKLPLIVLVTVLCRTPRSESANFPLTGCFTDEIDFLFLYSDSRPFNLIDEQEYFTEEFVKQFVGSSEMSTRVKFAGVYDYFSVSGSQINVSSWWFNNLHAFFEQLKSARKIQQQPQTETYFNVNETIKTKTQLIERLFSEMAGVRENVTHVAVIFIYGYYLTFEDCRYIPRILQHQEVTDIKIFVVVLALCGYSKIWSLNDTLLIGDETTFNFHHPLIMAICNQCRKGWLARERIDFLSCYKLIDYEFHLGYDLADYTCSYNGSGMVTVESDDELVFLQNEISSYLKHSDKHKSDLNETLLSSTEFFIGLLRNQNNFDKRYFWDYLKNQIQQPRPFVVNHWLPGKPSGHLDLGCVVWRFEWNSTRDNVTDNPSNDSQYVDGWRDIDCRDKLTFRSLCEFILHRDTDNKSLLRIKPATNESFSQALAKGDFLIFRGNIVSVSANIANLEFVEFLKQTKQELFPFFDCGIDAPDPRYVSYIYVCDSVDHCTSGRDEMFCFEEKQDGKINEMLQQKCRSVKCCDGSCLPLQLVGDGDVHCKVCEHSSETELCDESEVIVNSLKANERCALICDDECVNLSKLNDGFTDCTGPEGPLDETIGKLVAADICYSKFGHRIWAPRCVNVKDIYGYFVGCTDMSHLKGCDDFECPDGYFKCPNTYCIPQHYVFDGSTDCPSGEDENELIIDSCTGNFACWNSKICLHPDTVCDGHPDCPYQDDEVDCHKICHENLRCISGTVTVADYNFSIKKIILPAGFYKNVHYLDLSGVNLSNETFELMSAFPKITVINLRHCRINGLRNAFKYFSKGLQELDLSYNELKTLHIYNLYHPLPENIRYLNLSFNKELVEMINSKLNFLLTLDLSHTSFSNFDKSLFSWFPNMRNLNLSFTKISNIHRNTFPHNSFLQTLDLRGITIGDFNNNFFNGLTINQDLYTDNYESCCPMIRGKNIPDYRCHAPENAISSCFDLIGVNVQRVFLWVFAVLAILGNVTVIGYRVIWDRSILRTGYGLFVTNLGISDFIMGVYLFIIAGADYYYRDIYVFYDKIWRQSDTCKLAGFLASLSSETSTIFIFFITLDRFLIMKFPFGQVKFTKMSKSIVLSLSWIIGFLLALIPIVFRFEINSSNAMCLGLPLTTKRISGWEFSFAVFIGLNFCLVLLIAYGQRAIFQAISENRMARVASRRAGDITVAKQLSLVAMSSFLCWFPVGLMGFLSIGGHVINNDVYAWTAVIVLPINSAANPLLYTIPTVMAKWEAFRSDENRSGHRRS